MKGKVVALSYYRMEKHINETIRETCRTVNSVLLTTFSTYQRKVQTEQTKGSLFQKNQVLVYDQFTQSALVGNNSGLCLGFAFAICISDEVKSTLRTLTTFLDE